MSYNRRSASPVRAPSPGPGGRRPTSFMDMGSSSGLPTIPSLPSFAPPGGYSNANGGNGGLGGSGLGGGGLSFYNPGPPNNYGSNFSYNSGFYGGAPGSPLSSMGLQPYPAASQGLPPPPSFSSPSFEQPMQLSRRDSFGSGAGGPPGGRRGSVSGSGRSRMISGGPGSPGSSMGGMGGGLGPAGFAGLGTSDIPPYPTTAGNDAPLFGTGPLAPTTPNLNRPSGSGAPGSSRGTPVVSPSLPSSANMGGSAKASPQIGSTSAAGQAPGSGGKVPGRTTRQYRKKTPPEACAVCGTDTTPEWRKGPSGLRTLCNACGLTAAKQPTRDPQTIEEVWQQLTDIGVNRYRGNFTLKQEAKDAAARSWYAAKESGQQPRVSNRGSYAARNREQAAAASSGAGGSGHGPTPSSSGRPNSVGRNPNDLEGAQALFSMSRGRNSSVSNGGGNDQPRDSNSNFSPNAPQGGFASAAPNPPTMPGPAGFANPSPARRNSLSGGAGGNGPGRMSISSMLNTDPPPRPSSAASNRSSGSRSGLYR